MKRQGWIDLKTENSESSTEKCSEREIQRSKRKLPYSMSHVVAHVPSKIATYVAIDPCAKNANFFSRSASPGKPNIFLPAMIPLLLGQRSKK